MKPTINVNCVVILLSKWVKYNGNWYIMWVQPLNHCMYKGVITTNKANKIRKAFTLHLQKLTNSQVETKNFEPKLMHNVGSMSQEDIKVKMTWEKLYSFEDGMKEKNS